MLMVCAIAVYVCKFFNYLLEINLLSNVSVCSAVSSLEMFSDAQ